MKRTPFKRKAQAWAPRPEREYRMPQANPEAFRAPAVITTAAAPVVKAEPIRSDAYRRAVASLPCVICGVPGYSQAAHGSAGKGMALKACDVATLFPACADRPGVRGCHSQLDQGALYPKHIRRELEPVWAADTQRRIHAMGLWPKGVPFSSDSLVDKIRIPTTRWAADECE